MHWHFWVKIVMILMDFDVVDEVQKPLGQIKVHGRNRQRDPVRTANTGIFVLCSGSHIEPCAVGTDLCEWRLGRIPTHTQQTSPLPAALFVEGDRQHIPQLLQSSFPGVALRAASLPADTLVA